MKSLTGVDAAFLHLETPETPMHVGSVSLFDLPPRYRRDFHAEVKRQLGRRLHLAPVLHRKLAPMPLQFANPVWVDDDAVDLDHHVQRVTLAPPGTMTQFDDCIGRLHAELLDRSRPLWRLHVIDGLESGQVGYYFKDHHAALDGQAGIVLARTLFDLSPRPPPVPRAKGALAGEHRRPGRELNLLVEPQERWVRAFQNDGSVCGVETTLRTKSGEFRHVYFSIDPLEMNGETFGLVLSIDITERKQAEEALRKSEENLRAVLNATTESVLLISADDILLDLNEIAAQRLGSSRDRLIGCKLPNLMPPEVEARRRPYIEQVFSTGKMVSFEDERNGRWMLNHIHPILDAQGRVERLAVFSRDLTERKQAEEEIRQLR